MKVVDPGHDFELALLDGLGSQRLTFVKRVGEMYPMNEPPAHEGTTLQEVFRACIARTQYVQKQIPHPCNLAVIQHLRDSIRLLEERAAERHGRRDNFLRFEDQNIEDVPTCPVCGHIYCEEHAQ